MADFISNTALASFARNTIKPVPGSGLQFPLVQASDPEMELPSRALFEDIMALVKQEIPPGTEYTEDGKFDCDDFSFMFKGLTAKWYQKTRPNSAPIATGIGWGIFPGFGGNVYHALNWVILDDRRMYWIEPQDIATKDLDEAMRRLNRNGDSANLLMV